MQQLRDWLLAAIQLQERAAEHIKITIDHPMYLHYQGRMDALLTVLNEVDTRFHHD